MEKTMSWDKDGDGLIENDGKPDQTYDTWVMSGASSYCNSLWISSLVAFKAMLESCNHHGKAEEVGKLLLKAANAFHEKLWLEEKKFFRFDQAPHGDDIVMADQLCGLWYLKLCEMEGDVFDPIKTSLALDTIYKLNVLEFAGGQRGAVNGMRFREKW